MALSMDYREKALFLLEIWSNDFAGSVGVEILQIGHLARHAAIVDPEASKREFSEAVIEPCALNL